MIQLIQVIRIGHSRSFRDGRRQFRDNEFGFAAAAVEQSVCFRTTGRIHGTVRQRQFPVVEQTVSLCRTRCLDTRRAVRERRRSGIAKQNGCCGSAGDIQAQFCRVGGKSAVRHVGDSGYRGSDGRDGGGHLKRTSGIENQCPVVGNGGNIGFQSEVICLEGAVDSHGAVIGQLCGAVFDSGNHKCRTQTGNAFYHGISSGNFESGSRIDGQSRTVIDVQRDIVKSDKSAVAVPGHRQCHGPVQNQCQLDIFAAVRFRIGIDAEQVVQGSVSGYGQESIPVFIIVQIQLDVDGIVIGGIAGNEIQGVVDGGVFSCGGNRFSCNGQRYKQSAQVVGRCDSDERFAGQNFRGISKSADLTRTVDCPAVGIPDAGPGHPCIAVEQSAVQIDRAAGFVFNGFRTLQRFDGQSYAAVNGQSFFIENHSGRRVAGEMQVAKVVDLAECAAGCVNAAGCFIHHIPD